LASLLKNPQNPKTPVGFALSEAAYSNALRDCVNTFTAKNNNRRSTHGDPGDLFLARLYDTRLSSRKAEAAIHRLPVHIDRPPSQHIPRCGAVLGETRQAQHCR